MYDLIRLPHKNMRYTVVDSRDIIIARWEKQHIIIPEGKHGVQVSLTGEHNTLVCYGHGCYIIMKSWYGAIELPGRDNTVICAGGDRVNVSGDNNNLVVSIRCYIHCNGHGCIVSGSLEGSSVYLSGSENCTVVCNGSIRRLVPGKNTKVIINQVVYSEGKELLEGEEYETVNGVLKIKRFSYRVRVKESVNAVLPDRDILLKQWWVPGGWEGEEPLGSAFACYNERGQCQWIQFNPIDKRACLNNYFGAVEITPFIYRWLAPRHDDYTRKEVVADIAEACTKKCAEMDYVLDEEQEDDMMLLDLHLDDE